MNIKKSFVFLIYFKTSIVRRYIGGKGGTFEYITREYTLGSYLADVVSKLDFIKVFLDVEMWGEYEWRRWGLQENCENDIFRINF